MALTDKRILITGAAGHIGSHVAHACVQAGAHVIAAVRPSSDTHRLHAIKDQVELLLLDLASVDAEAVYKQARSVDIVLHIGAAGVNPQNTDLDYLKAVNENGTRAMLELAHRWQVERFVHTGSCFEYPAQSYVREDTKLAPRTDYAMTKARSSALTQLFAAQHHLPFVILRPFTVYGEGEAPHRVVSNTIRACLENQPFDLTGGEQTRDFIHVEDVARAFVLAASQPDIEGGIFNVCTGDECSIRALVELILELTNSQAEPRFGALPYRDNEFFQISGDPTRARERLGFEAQISLPDGLSRLIAWYKGQGSST